MVDWLFGLVSSTSSEEIIPKRFIISVDDVFSGELVFCTHHLFIKKTLLTFS